MRAVWATAVAAALVLCGWVSTTRGQTSFNPKGSILNSKHDFRATSTTPVRAVSENDPCVFCHTPHNATPGPELWNHKMGTRVFPSYTSSTLQASVGAITETDSSKLCLSCHDGTIALASTVNSGELEFLQGPDFKLPITAPANLAGEGSVGFADDHPFAFAPNLANPEVRLPPPGDAVRLEAGKVQCVSCHDPHIEQLDAVQAKFLVKANRASALCLTCHLKTGWAAAAHQQPPDPAQNARYTSAQGAHTGYLGVAENGCESCHRPHSAGVAARLLKLTEENTCYACHDGSVTDLRLKDDFATKTYHHPVDITPSAHDAAESPTSTAYRLPEVAAAAPRHAECADCHNSHTTQAIFPGFVPNPPAVTPPLLGVKGQSVSNGFLPQASNEYEICFKCHGDSANKPQLTDISSAGIGYGRNPKRQSDVANPNAYNTRLEFTTAASFHPVTQPRGTTVLSLRPFMLDAAGTDITSRPLTGASQIYCSDCHNSDNNSGLRAGNTGARGPHGSIYPHLLERQNVLATPPATPGAHGSELPYSLSNYALCNKCHDVPNVIYEDRTFPEHKKHLEFTACSTCHDPHASPSPRLINFDLSIVAPSASGPVRFTQTSPGHGSCTLTCHGEDHNPETY